MKISHKVIALLSAGVLACSMVGVAGCSQQDANKELTTEQIKAQDIQVTASGYTVLDNNTVSYAFTVENPNDGYVANSVTFTIEGYDENNVMLIGGGETLQQVYPGITTAAAGTSYLSNPDATIARFEIKPLMQNVLWTKSTETKEQLTNMFQLSNTEVSDNNDAMTITGTISTEIQQNKDNTAANNRRDAHVVAILRNADGNIICGGSAMGVMLDPSMTPIVTGTAPNSDGSAPEGEQPQNADNANQNKASTNFTITIPGIVDYSKLDVYATPGM